jgi:hypothetical protein
VTAPPSPALPAPGAASWTPLGDKVAGQSAMYAINLPASAGALTGPLSAVLIDQRLARFELHPGTAEPGGSWSVPSAVAPSEVSTVLAAFNSGFKFKDAHGGFFADGRWAPAPQAGAATAVIDSDGMMKVGQWGRDLTAAPAMVGARQNLVLLVDNGLPTPASQNPKAWGATVRAAPLAWRSALGVTDDGSVLYVAGPSQSVSSLVAGLMLLGAREAMELDINQAWVTFNIYTHDVPDPSVVTGHKLDPAMSKPAERYLTSDPRDFFVVTSRA